MERLDDKELICFSCHNLFLYFDPMSRMAVWKERLGGTGFGSADQLEHWVWTDRRWLMDSDALSSKALGWNQRYWAGLDTLQGDGLRDALSAGIEGAGQKTAG